MGSNYKIINGDCVAEMKMMKDESIHNVITEYICPVCLIKFSKRVTKKCQNVYCSNKCRYKGISLGITKVVSGKDRKKYKKREGSEKYKDKYCELCGKLYYRAAKKSFLCSDKCARELKKEQMSGKKNPFYIDGRSKNKKSYRGEDWDNIRLKIYKRDNYTCQECGIKCVSKREAIRDKSKSKKIIQCHHIVEYDIKLDNNEDDNLITLCLKCHATNHNNNSNAPIKYWKNKVGETN